MPVLCDNPAFFIQDGDIHFSSDVDGLSMDDKTVRFRIGRSKGDPILDVTLKSAFKLTSVSFRLNDIGCGSTIVEKPQDMPEKIWTRFAQMYQRFLVLREPLFAERSREETARKQAEEVVRQQTIDEIEAAIK